MEQIQPQLKAITRLEVISKLLLIIAVIFLIFIVSHNCDIILHKTYCFGKNVLDIVYFFATLFGVTAIILEVIAISTRFIKHLPWKKPIFIFILFFLLIIFIAFFMAISMQGRCKTMSAKILSDLRIIAAAQEIFYQKNSRYADTQQELSELMSVAYDPVTKKEYTDEDGVGIEGGDDNPNTWSVQALLRDAVKREICLEEQPEPETSSSIGLCNEDGC